MEELEQSLDMAAAQVGGSSSNTLELPCRITAAATKQCQLEWQYT
jgi:hypothetical protein